MDCMIQAREESVTAYRGNRPWPALAAASLFHCRKGKLFRPFQAVFLGAESQAARVVTCSKLWTLKGISLPAEGYNMIQENMKVCFGEN